MPVVKKIECLPVNILKLISFSFLKNPDLKNKYIN